MLTGQMLTYLFVLPIFLMSLTVKNAEASDAVIVKTRKGFTLIELLVVIAVIALLMAILMPALARVKKQAKAIACQSNLHQWALVFKMYTAEYDGYFWSGDITGDGWNQYCWVQPLKPYHNDEAELRFCPMATKLRTEGGRDPFAAWETRGDSSSFRSCWNRRCHYGPGQHSQVWRDFRGFRR